jgi:predicted XRE-type DNA-binding protein
MIEIQAGSGNIYADLSLQQAQQMLIKAQLADKIREIIQKRKLTQQQAASLLLIRPHEVLTGGIFDPWVLKEAHVPLR